jgi:hypothetical protein
MRWGTNRDLVYATLVEQRLSRKSRAVILAVSDINASRSATRNAAYPTAMLLPSGWKAIACAVRHQRL